MTDNELELIKQTLNSKGWELIETIFNEEINAEKQIKTDNRRFEDIAVEAIAITKFRTTLEKFIGRLHNIKSAEKKVATVYK